VSEELIEGFRARILERKPLRIRGGGSKDFYGGIPSGELLDTRNHAGIVNYEPTELVVTVRGGTLLADLESALAARRQCLACEPPHFGAATVGGAVATGLSGPRRAAVGSVRDFVLGVKLMDGEGRVHRFGGEVMKNVAGFDVSRLVAGSLGTLGLILEVSLKVLPVTPGDASLRFEMPQDKALEAMNRWAGQPLPLVASCWHDGILTLRLAGARAAVDAACVRLGGSVVAGAEAAVFWQALREQTADFFSATDDQGRCGDSRCPRWRRRSSCRRRR
jgi:glycolate oxidase FAD binding subunit